MHSLSSRLFLHFACFTLFLYSAAVIFISIGFTSSLLFFDTLLLLAVEEEEEEVKVGEIYKAIAMLKRAIITAYVLLLVKIEDEEFNFFSSTPSSLVVPFSPP